MHISGNANFIQAVALLANPMHIINELQMRDSSHDAN